MVEISTIPPYILPLFIERAYSGDKELLETYHIVNGSLEFCVKEQVKIIRTQSRFDNLVFYGLKIADDIIGYMVIGENYLFSYCINIAYRTKVVLMDWWAQVIDLFKGHFGTFLYKKNDRALRFMIRNGMEVIDEKPNYVTLIYTGPWPLSSPQQ